MGFSIGDRVIWNWYPRGGYGFVIPVPATVVAVNKKTVTIAAQLKDGSTVNRHVPARNLRTAA